MKTKFNWRCFLLVLFYLLLGSLLLKQALDHLDPDLGWHLKFGRDILLNRQLPADQIHLWTLTGSTWVDHEWLSGVLMWLIFSTSGYVVLAIIFAGLTLAGFYLINRQLVNKSWGAALAAAAFSWLGLVSLQPLLGVRVQIITFLFLIIELLILKNYQAGQKNFFYFLPPLFWLWANLHAGWLAGAAVLLWWLMVKVAKIVWQKMTRNITNLNFKKLIVPTVIVLASLTATAATPYGLKLYDFLSGYARVPFFSAINEWQPLYVFPINYPALVMLGIISALLIVNLFISERRTRLPVWQWSLMIIFLLAGWRSVRHLPLTFAVAGVLLLPSFFIEKSAINLPLPRLWRRVLKILTAVILIITSGLTLLYTNFTARPFAAFTNRYPVAAVSWLRQQTNYRDLKIFNHYNFGGWLIWVWPEKQLFIDGRLPQYPFAGHSLLEEYLSISGAAAARLAEYDIELVLWTNQTKIYRLTRLDKLFGFKEAIVNGQVDRVKNYLATSADWQQVFSDDTAVIYVRRDRL